HTVTSPFGNRTHPVQGGTKFHEGIDIGAPKGSTVVAAGSGTVEVAGYSPYNGNWVKIDHGNGLETLYLHNSSLKVSSGQRVS
ncbi:M23 family metallopeptidase, partial [Anaerostipes caccae]